MASVARPRISKKCGQRKLGIDKRLAVEKLSVHSHRVWIHWVATPLETAPQTVSRLGVSGRPSSYSIRTPGQPKKHRWLSFFRGTVIGVLVRVFKTLRTYLPIPPVTDLVQCQKVHGVLKKVSESIAWTSASCPLKMSAWLPSTRLILSRGRRHQPTERSVLWTRSLLSRVRRGSPIRHWTLLSLLRLLNVIRRRHKNTTGLNGQCRITTLSEPIRHLVLWTDRRISRRLC